MKATLIVIESDADLEEAQAQVAGLMDSDDPADISPLQAQARLIEAHERAKWPRPAPKPADILAYLMDQAAPS